MEPTRHLEILRAEGDLLASMPAELLDAPVPSVPGWDVERAVRHTGKTHQWVTALVRTGTPVDTADLAGIATGPACLDDYRDSLDALAAAFVDADPHAPAFTFEGPGDVAFWMRRQAQEVSVHRMDAADAVAAAGGPPPAPLAVDGAGDGIDEWATLFLTARLARGPQGLPEGLDGRTVHLHGTDDPPPEDGAEWLLTFADAEVHTDAVHAKGDVALRGPVADLFLVLWRRRPLDAVDVFGDRSVAERLLDAARF